MHASMPINDNQVAGHSLARMAALSDGLFAIAMTLLVFEIHAPATETIRSEGDLLSAVIALWPRLIMYLMGFLTLGISWVGQQRLLDGLAHADRNLIWIQITFLSSAALVPFSTEFLADFIDYRTAVLFYWANVLVLGLGLYFSWRYAVQAKLVKETVTQDLSRAIERQILIAQALYAFGALLSLIHPYLGIAVIFLLQISLAVAPRVGVLSRL